MSSGILVFEDQDQDQHQHQHQHQEQIKSFPAEAGLTERMGCF
jgi:hypothetical protein